MIQKVFLHLRNGTWAEALRFRLDQWLTPIIERRRERHVRNEGIHRFDIRNRSEALHFLAVQANEWQKKRPGKIVLFGSETDSDLLLLKGRIEALGLSVLVTKDLNELPEAASVSCAICCSFSTRIQNEYATKLNRSHTYSSVPFEYVARPAEALAPVKKLSLHTSHDFISPLLTDSVDHFGIYQESLSHFELKCDIRDYMDLAQAVTHISERKIEGDVCEFGSYKGHSGYLIARLLEAKGSGKTVHLFDTFEQFPEENAGVDAFWSGTHPVDFDQVRTSLSGCTNVRLVKGDFTRTFETAGIDRVSFAHIDCDSYRATRYLLEELFSKRLSPNGIVVCEDYGHPSLLGNRLAVQEFFEGRTDCFTFFSQFSGCFVAVKR